LIAGAKMKFKTDENLPQEAATLLTDAGYDAQSIFDEGLGGEQDAHISDICQKGDRILITQDTGFSDVRLFPPHEFPGIVVLRLRDQSKPHVLSVLKRVLLLLAHETPCGCLWIVEDTRIRIRES